MVRESIQTPEGVKVSAGDNNGLWISDGDRYRFLSSTKVERLLRGKDVKV